MTKVYFTSLLLFFIALQTSAQCEENRYRNFVFENYSLTADLVYGSNLDYQDNETDLYLDVYEPTGDDEIGRPLVIVVHGGSFVAGSKDGDDVVPLCQDLAKMGYVVASIQYRLGIPILGPIAQNAKKAVIRGMHDAKAAVRYFRRDVQESGNTFDIDPEQIYMAGVSAGGFNALNVAYLDSDEEIPSDIDLSANGLGGGAEGLSGNPGYSSHVAGIINIAGAIAELSMIESGDVPACSFHGTGDTTVPYGSDILTLIGVVEVDTVHGSASVHERLDALEIENCLHTQWLEGHVPHVTNTLHYDTLLSVSSNFLSHLICPDIALDCEYREIELISSVDEQGLLENISIWPNPVSNTLNVEGLDLATNYQLMDVYGRLVVAGRLELGQNTLDTQDLAPGLYLLQLDNDKGHWLSRLMK